jgi:hypothetical protein
VYVLRLRGNDDAPALRLGDIITLSLGDRIERQCAVCKRLDKLQAAHLLLLPLGNCRVSGFPLWVEPTRSVATGKDDRFREGFRMPARRERSTR